MVATATVLGGHTTINPPKPAVVGRTFGVIGAWDGQRVDRGRVVVDATWHHFFNINLTGDPGSPEAAKRQGFYNPPVPNAGYEQIKAYYRNIVYWLIPADRGWYWLETLAAHLRGSAFLQQELPRVSTLPRIDLRWILHFAQLAEHYFGNARGACWRWHLTHFPELYERLPFWKTLRYEVDPFLRPELPEERPDRFVRHPALSVSRDVLGDVLFGATVAVVAQWVQEQPEEELSAEQWTKLVDPLVELLEGATGELREHLGRLSRHSDALRADLG